MSCKIISGSGALCVCRTWFTCWEHPFSREWWGPGDDDIRPQNIWISTAKMTIIPVAPYSLATSFIFIYSVSTEDFPFWWVICTYKFHNEHTIAVYKCSSMTGARPPNIFHLSQQSLLGRLDVFLGLTADEQNPRGAKPWKSLNITVHNDNGLDPRCLGVYLISGRESRARIQKVLIKEVYIKRFNMVLQA